MSVPSLRTMDIGGKVDVAHLVQQGRSHLMCQPEFLRQGLEQSCMTHFTRDSGQTISSYNTDAYLAKC